MLLGMADHLLRWALSVKARQLRRGRAHAVLWLFTDAVRLPDPMAAIAGLPWRGPARGLCGVVWRHGADPAPARRLCRARAIALSVAGRPGGHARDSLARLERARTAACHSWPALRRAGRALPFLSPVFATASHPGARPLGVVRWAALARRVRGPVLALGGVDSRSCRRLPRWCGGAGAIGALCPSRHSVS